MIDFTIIAAFLATGIVAGFISQRSRLCFTSAVRDLVLFGATGMTRAVLILLLFTSQGGWLALLARGAAGWPIPAYSAPSPAMSVAGGALFGLGMALAGSCAASALWRLGEGQTSQAFILVGLVAGTWIYQTWPLAPDAAYAASGYRSIQMTFIAGLLAIIRTIELRRADAGEELPPERRGPAWRAVWPPEAGAVALALLLSLFLALTGQIWRVTRAFTFTDWSALLFAGGLILGGYFGARIGREFRVRRSGSRPQIAVRLAGGLLMGYGARMAWGCTVGALMSGLAIASAQAWFWLGGAVVGALIGTTLLWQILRRYA